MSAVELTAKKPQRGFFLPFALSGSSPVLFLHKAKTDTEKSVSVLLCMGYINNISAVLRKNSNSRKKNEILADARVKSANADEIFVFASDEIKSTLPPSRRISSNEVGFHRRR